MTEDEDFLDISSSIIQPGLEYLSVNELREKILRELGKELSEEFVQLSVNGNTNVSQKLADYLEKRTDFVSVLAYQKIENARSILG